MEIPQPESPEPKRRQQNKSEEKPEVGYGRRRSQRPGSGCVVLLAGSFFGLVAGASLGAIVGSFADSSQGVLGFVGGLCGVTVGAFFLYALDTPAVGKRRGEVHVEVVSTFIGLLSAAVIVSYLCHIGVSNRSRLTVDSGGPYLALSPLLLGIGMLLGAVGGRKLSSYLGHKLNPRVLVGGGFGAVIGMPVGLFAGALLSAIIAGFEIIFTWWFLIGELACVILGWALSVLIILLMHRTRKGKDSHDAGIDVVQH